MKRLSSILLLTVVASLLAAVPAFAANGKQGGVPPELRVPEGYELTLKTTGVGVQVYDCNASGAWTFREPRAGIFKQNGKLVATHFRGPTWQSVKDYSSVVGTVKAQTAAPNPQQDIPWLLLGATSNTGGPDSAFGEVDYIQRLDTKGGVAPAGSCTTGQVAKVPYSSTYNFWVPED